MATHNIYPHPNPDGTDADLRVSIQWQRPGHVAVATAKLAEGADRTQEWLPASGDQPPRPAWDGMYVPLDRDQINHLIRQLRAARDQAYGRDE